MKDIISFLKNNKTLVLIISLFIVQFFLTLSLVMYLEAAHVKNTQALISQIFAMQNQFTAQLASNTIAIQNLSLPANEEITPFYASKPFWITLGIVSAICLGLIVYIVQGQKAGPDSFGNIPDNIKLSSLTDSSITDLIQNINDNFSHVNDNFSHVNDNLGDVNKSLTGLNKGFDDVNMNLVDVNKCLTGFNKGFDDVNMNLVDVNKNFSDVVGRLVEHFEKLIDNVNGFTDQASNITDDINGFTDQASSIVNLLPTLETVVQKLEVLIQSLI